MCRSVTVPSLRPNQQRETDSQRQTENNVVRCRQFATAIALPEQVNNGARVLVVGAAQSVTAITRVLPPPAFAQLRTIVQRHTSTLCTTTLYTCSSSHLRIILSPPDRPLMNPVDVSKLVHGTNRDNSQKTVSFETTDPGHASFVLRGVQEHRKNTPSIRHAQL